jgi:hypothetical protein
MSRRTKSEIMAGVDCIESKIIANNTVEYVRENGDRVIRLHLTDIVTFKANGSVVYDSGGWQTVTTKERMNRFGSGEVDIWQKNKIWWADYHGATYAYADGITFHNGNVTGQGEDPTKKLRLKKRIKKYVDGYMKALTSRKLDPPSGGDCWYCCLKDQDGNEMGRDSQEHLFNHFKEKYYVPSMVCNAAEEFGASMVERNSIGYWLNMHEQEGWGVDFAKKQVKSHLTRYIERRLGFAA